MRASEQVIFPAERKWAYSIFDRIVVNMNAAVLQISTEFIPSVPCIAHGFTDLAFR